jgi:CheY-like chemotaxis protein
VPLLDGIADDRASIRPGDRVLLIVDGEAESARSLLELARDRGLKGLAATQGSTALLLARRFQPTAIMLDLGLSHMDGRRLLDLLKHDPITRHIPVSTVSVTDEWPRGFQLGAVDQLKRPASTEALGEAVDKLLAFAARPAKRLLLVEGSAERSASIRELLGDGDVEVTLAESGSDALSRLGEQSFDCVVVDLDLPDIPGLAVVERLREQLATTPPVIVYPSREPTAEESNCLARFAELGTVQTVRSPQRLLSETALVLHRPAANWPEPARALLHEAQQTDPVLANKTVLVVDDDIRNIFALTSVLERCQMQVLHAENGREGIEVLTKTPGIDIVLMDVMMPEMDGLETMRRIRAQPRFASMPMIALTAKAMQGDREQCIEAGASDYITKPVDVEQLLSALRVWLWR